MHSHELPCSYVGFFHVFSSPADYRGWDSDDWDSESVDCCHFVFARELNGGGGGSGGGGSSSSNSSSS